MADFRLISQSDIQTGQGGSPGAQMGNIGVGDGLAMAGYGDLAQNIGGRLFGIAAQRKAQKEREDQMFQKAHDARVKAEARREARESWPKLLEDLEGIEDDLDDEGNVTPGGYAEDKWAEFAYERLSQTQTQLTSGGAATEEARAELEQMALDLFAEQSLKVGTLAKARKAERMKAAFVMAADSAYEAGDKEAGDAELDLMSEAGLEFPEAIAARKLKGRRYADVLEANRDMDADPIGTVDAFADSNSYPDLDSNQRLALRREAEVRMRRLQADNAQELAMQLDQGEPVSEDELRRKVDSKELTAAAAKAIRKAMHGMKPGAMASTMSEIDRAITAYDPVRDTDTSQYYGVQDLIYALPAERRSELLGRLRDKRDPKSQSNRSAVTDAYKHADWMLNSGMLGPMDLDDKPSEEAIWKHLKMKDEIDRIVEESPGIDREALIKRLRKANQPAQEAPALELAEPEPIPGIFDPWPAPTRSRSF